MPMEDAMAAFTCWDSEGSMYLEFTACFLFLFFFFVPRRGEHLKLPCVGSPQMLEAGILFSCPVSSPPITPGRLPA